MAVRVAINGFGRIGRLVLRSIVEFARRDIEVVSNQRPRPDRLFRSLACGMNSVHGRFPWPRHRGGRLHLTSASARSRWTAIRNPAELPHRDLGVDIALECTGFFTKKETARAHLDAGAKRVLVSAPCDNADKTIVFGVNHATLTRDGHRVVSNGSCTTNCLAPVCKGAPGQRRDRAWLHDHRACLHQRSAHPGSSCTAISTAPAPRRCR